MIKKIIKWLLKKAYEKEIDRIWQIVRNKDEQIKNLQNQIITIQANIIKQPKERIFLR